MQLHLHMVYSVNITLTTTNFIITEVIEYKCIQISVSVFLVSVEGIRYISQSLNGM